MNAIGPAGLAVVVGVLGLGASAPPSDLRTDLETVGLALDRAVLQVSRPSRNPVGRSAARGYRLEGFGAMFVLAPRALPLPAPAPTAEEQEIVRTLSEAARELERRLPQVASDDMRLQLQLSLSAMRQAEADLRVRQRMGNRAAGDAVPAEGEVVPKPRTLEDTLHELERDVQMQLSLQAEAMQGPALPPQVRQDLEERMRFVNRQAEAFAAEAERARQEAERVIWLQLGQQPPEPPTVPASASAAPAEPAAPARPALEQPQLAILSPWQLWIDPMDDPTPDPQAVIRGVGEAVMSVLEQYGARLHALAPQELVAVAIDFVPATRPGIRVRPARTLMVRAKKADIDQRASGAITPAEFRRRVELVEY